MTRWEKAQRGELYVPRVDTTLVRLYFEVYVKKHAIFYSCEHRVGVQQCVLVVRASADVQSTIHRHLYRYVV